MTQTTRLLKTKMFVEQLYVRRKVDGPPGSWEPPITQSKPIDKAINDWVDSTGNEIVNVSTPGMFMQWMDQERTIRLVVVTAMVTFIPALTQETTNNVNQINTNRQEPVPLGSGPEL